MTEKSARVKSEQAKQIRASLELFIQMTNDPIYPAQVTNALLDDYETTKLVLVPDHEELVRRTEKTTSVQESISARAGTTYKRLTLGEIAKRMARLRAFLRWVRSRGELRLVGRPAATAIKKKDSEERDQFSLDDLTLLFSAPVYQIGRGELTKVGTFKHFKPWHYWGPLIALHSGMRPNEQCQMLLSDIIDHKGSWWFDIDQDDSEDDPTGKTLKTANSRRRIPVHPFLLRLGLIEYRDRLRQEGRTRLFEEWSAHATHRRYSPKASEWFNGNFRKARLGESATRTKTLYSFRHNFSTALMESGCTERIAITLLGHSRGEGELRRRYDKAHDSPALVPAIEQLNFHLPFVAKFDIDAGVHALADANRRSENKRKGDARAKVRRQDAGPKTTATP